MPIAIRGAVNSLEKVNNADLSLFYNTSMIYFSSGVESSERHLFWVPTSQLSPIHFSYIKLKMSPSTVIALVEAVTKYDLFNF